MKRNKKQRAPKLARNRPEIANVRDCPAGAAKSDDGSTSVKDQPTVVEVPIDSFESRVGYASLFRQMHRSFLRQVAFYRSKQGGALSIEEARMAAFHACANEQDAKELLESLMRLPVELIDFADLMQLQEIAPQAAEWFWENAKVEGREEFRSGHGAANIAFPQRDMSGLWNIARYLGVRESFIDEWSPRGGIELSLIDMLAQSYFQWQFWLEKTVTRSRTAERQKTTSEEYGWEAPTVSEQEAIEHAAHTADRWNRIFMRTLRHLRDLRRYPQLTINNPDQVNIAGEGGQQINIKDDGPKQG